MKKPPNINDEDKELFRQEMKGVRTLKSQNKIITDSRKTSAKTRQSAVAEKTTLHLNDGSTSYYSGDQSLFYAQSGLQNKTIRQLRQGKLPLQANIDLHGQTSQQAKQNLEEFLAHSLQQGIRYCHIIHGKGEHGRQSGAILKNKVYGWLLNNPYILAFCSCQNKDGGTGALYVILKKC